MTTKRHECFDYCEPRKSLAEEEKQTVWYTSLVHLDSPGFVLVYATKPPVFNPTSFFWLNVLRRVMAAAEARAIWQRTTNRCFVQEDAKRAPKIACCQSSSSSKPADSCSIGVAGAHDQPAVGLMPLNRIPSYPNMPADMKWWLQLQPSYGPQKGSTNELLNALEDGVESNYFCYDPVSPRKAQPWWHKTDEEDLASFVVRKSMDFVENCDLPPPQKMHVRRYSHEQFCSLDIDEEYSSAWKSRIGYIPGTIINADVQCDSFSTTQKDFMEQVAESDPTKAQLLEALRRSQTRAREAEKAAKQAYAEKEHIIELIFKQASQISAYKQWIEFKMLQLDALYFQIKNNKQPVSPHFPLLLPWTSYKSRKSWKSLTGKGRRAKWSQPRPSIMKHAVAFALGLSLVSAGLLVGWTLGWMLPF